VPRNDYLERVLKARVYDVAIESPLELRGRLSRRLGNRLLLKREDLQPSSRSSCAARTTRWRSCRAQAAKGRDRRRARATTRRASRSPRRSSAAAR
jgi:hypothetical protein